MISTRHRHEYVNPAIFDALTANNRASRKLLVLASYCNLCAVSVATSTPSQQDLLRAFTDIQDSILEANTDISRTHEHIAELI